MKRWILFWAAVMAFAGTETAQCDIVFDTDFDAGVPSQVTGQISLESVDAFAGLGQPGNQFGGQFLRNDGVGDPAPATVLTLTNLPNHVSVDIDFLLAIINTWDGFESAWGPDVFNVRVDGTTVFSEVIALRSGSMTYDPPVGANLGDVRATNSAWGSWLWSRGYDMGLEPAVQGIPHTSSTLTVEFFASGTNYGQASADESWAIDNLQVTVAVPESSAFACLSLIGFAGGLCLAWRKLFLAQGGLGK